MELLRYVFLVLVLGGSTSIGFLLSGKYSDRVDELNCFLNFMNILQNKIKFTHKPIGEILEEIAEIKRNSNIAELFLKVGEKLKSKKMEEAWNEAISEEKFFLSLKNEDLDIIKTLGNVLRKNRYRWSDERDKSI